MPRVLPCPFCGTQEVTYDPASSAVFCNDCHAEGGLEGLQSWNERSTEAACLAIMKHLRQTGVPAGAGDIFMSRLRKLEERAAKDSDDALRAILCEALFSMSKAMSRSEDPETTKTVARNHVTKFAA